VAINSTNLAEGQQSAASQYNTLRDDLITQHDHTTGQGGTVSHGDLTDAVISGTYIDHSDLNTHVQGSGTSDTPDAYGGDRGVHGLPALAYVLGSMSSQFVAQWGTDTTNGYQVVSGSYVDQTKTVTFPNTFASAPSVYVIPISADSARVGVYSVGTSSFQALIGFPFGGHATAQSNTDFYWIAVGTLA